MELGGGTLILQRPYLWNPDDERTRQYLKAETDYFNAVMKELGGAVAALMKAEAPSSAIPDQIKVAGGKSFFLTGGKLGCAESETDTTLLLGPSGLSGEKKKIITHTPSPNGEFDVVRLISPEEDSVLRVVDVKGHLLSGQIEGAWAAFPCWISDRRILVACVPESGPNTPPNQTRLNHDLYVCDINDGGLGHKIKVSDFSSLGIAAARLIRPSVAGEYAFARVTQQTDSYRQAILVQPVNTLSDPNVDWERVLEEYLISVATGYKGSLYAVSYKNSDHGEVIRLDLKQRIVETVLPASAGVMDAQDAPALFMAGSMGVYATRLTINEDTHEHELWHISEESGPTKVPLPLKGKLNSLSTDPERAGLFFTITTLSGESGHYRYDPVTGKVNETGRMSHIDPIQGIAVTIHAVEGADGEPVYYTMFSKEGETPDKAIVNPYAAYGSPSDLPDRGTLAVVKEYNVAWVVPHISSTMERGAVHLATGLGANQRENHERGNIELTAIMEDVRRRGVEKLGLYGFSAGGLRVGLAAMQQPDRVTAAVSLMGVQDGRFGRESTIAPFQDVTFGTVDDPEDYAAMHRDSVLEAAQRAAEERRRIAAFAALVSKGDARVPGHESLVTVAAARDAASNYAKASGKKPPLMLFGEGLGGHTDFEAYKATALTILLAELGAL
jgi:hypothetical protein